MSPVVKTSQRSRAIYYLTSLNVTSVCGSCLLSERQPRKGWQYLKQESWGLNLLIVKKTKQFNWGENMEIITGKCVILK